MTAQLPDRFGMDPVESIREYVQLVQKYQRHLLMMSRTLVISAVASALPAVSTLQETTGISWLVKAYLLAIIVTSVIVGFVPWYSTRRVVEVPPGWALLSFLAWLFSTRTIDRVFKPAVSDMQKEHIDALAEGKTWKARWVVVRGYWSVGAAVVAQAPISVVKLFVALWKAAS